MMYEHRSEPLLPRTLFIRRLFRHSLIGAGVIACSLAIGIMGYRLYAGLSWLDSLLNASMILGGVGPGGPLATGAGKLFASFYALFAGTRFSRPSAFSSLRSRTGSSTGCTWRKTSSREAILRLIAPSKARKEQSS
jgi:hypothetical protein